MSDSETEPSLVDAAKKAAGEAAAARVEDGTVVGLGTGSTTAYAIRAIARRRREEGLDVRGVATSFSAARHARENGLPLVDLGEIDRVDLAVDGADEIDPGLNLIKGRGGAHTRERVVAAEAREFLVVADFRKEVERLGETAPVPVEVVPMAVRPVSRALERLGGEPAVRRGSAKDGPVVTDQGLWILDVRFESIVHPGRLGRSIKQLPGVLDHGLFVDLATHALVGLESGGVRERSHEPGGEQTADRSRVQST